MGEAPDSDDEKEDENKTKDAKEEAKNLDKITDFVEEKEGSTKVDSKEIEERFKDLRRKKDEAEKKRAERDKELAAVKIKKEDVDLMCAELPLSDRDTCERVLRENGGELVPALRALMREFPAPGELRAL
eukprot:gnl/TRDRNA2_/TRDRNA2_179214_c0_seq1.p1 gnl/TRDRNA2_/TRDRNA2_179214_c0~~gnl/TRDRNA2_/TRDRNA2_179214_c0_seq1.p1  ORF type:complete len:130 (+),score=59.88 gnl/TRDRNA2_/TRDRNA2_179214_c0_seq1:100-489(+)